MAELLYDIIYLVTMSLIPALWSIDQFYEDAPLLAVTIISAAVSSVILIFIHLKNTGRIILGGSLLVIIAAYLFLIPEEVKTTFMENSPWLPVSLIVPVSVTLIGKVLCSFRPVRPLLSGILAVSMGYAMFIGANPPKAASTFAFFFILVTFADEMQAGWKKQGKLSGRKHIVYISPFLAAFLILLFLVPAPEKPYDWALAKKIIETASDRLYRIREYFASLSHGDSADDFLGFSEYASLVNDPGDNNKKVLEVTQITGSSSYAYLAGKTFDTFEGTEWIKTYENDTQDSLIDSLETLYSARLYAGEDYTDYIRHGQLNITVLNMYTNHFFTPHKYYNFFDQSGTLPYYANGGDPFSRDRLTYGDAYSAEYFRMNTDSPYFEDYLESDLPDDATVWSQTVGSFYTGDASKISQDDLILYRDRMREVYLTEPNLSPQLKAYLDELLADCTTDAEKLEKLEKLFNSMKYNIRVGRLPEDVDTDSEFLDYLILEKQEGYCTYYATAFVLVSRYIGIPSRFVQGYRVSLHNHGSATVTESNAHAWPECYIEGIGWISYEPTPGYRVSERWKTSEELAQERERGSVYEPEYTREEEIELPEAVASEHDKQRTIEWKYPVMIGALSAAAAIILLILIRIIGMIRYLLCDDDNKFRILFSRNMKLLRINGFVKEAEETYEEFKKRAAAVIPAGLLEFVEIYETYAYRGDEIDAGDVTLIRNNNLGLAEYTKKSGLSGRLSLIRYYLFMI